MDRPTERRAHARSALVWESLLPLLERGSQAVLDIGGGSGAFAVRVAEAGQAVMLVDPSPDAVAAAERRAAERGVDGLLSTAVGDLDSLAELAPGPYDLVLCHDVLGVAADASAALDQVRGVLRPGGHLSLLVGQLQAAILSKVVAGHLEQALELAQGTSDDLPRRFEYGQILALVEQAGFSVEQVHGVRVFADSVPSAVIDSDPAAYAQLVELERSVASRPEFAAWAAQLHVLARR